MRYHFWGAGGVGRRVLSYLVPTGAVCGIIDSDVSKQGSELCGLKIQSYEDAKPDIEAVIIGHFAPEPTEATLDRDSIPHVRLGKFVPSWYWTQQKLAVAFLDFPITSRCTLNCRHCMQYMPYRKEKSDVPIDSLLHSLGRLLNTFDVIGEISIIGGEPFLHPQLAELLQAIDLERIKSVVITTNGMVIPNDDVLKVCMEKNVHISISNYSRTIQKLSKGILEFEHLVNSRGVSCDCKHQTWMNPGTFSSKTINKTSNCNRTHFQLQGGNLWLCTVHCGAYLSGLCSAVNEIDFLDLTKQFDRNAVHAFITNTRTSQCDFCYMAMGEEVPVAEQVEVVC